MKIKFKPLPPIEYLEECFEIDLNSPSGLIWKHRPLSHFFSKQYYNLFNHLWEGKPAGYQNKKGYYQVGVKGVIYPLHRIVYALAHRIQDFNGLLIDHINRNKGDNRPENLRLVNDSQNKMNSDLSKNNKSGAKGVYWIPRDQKWTAQIRVNGKLVALGYHKDFESARIAYETAHLKYRGVLP